MRRWEGRITRSKESVLMDKIRKGFLRAWSLVDSSHVAGWFTAGGERSVFFWGGGGSSNSRRSKRHGTITIFGRRLPENAGMPLVNRNRKHWIFMSAVCPFLLGAGIFR